MRCGTARPEPLRFPVECTAKNPNPRIEIERATPPHTPHPVHSAPVISHWTLVLGHSAVLPLSPVFPSAPMITTTLFGLILGGGVAALLTLLFGVYTIGPTERGVLTTFGRAQRTNGTTADDPTLGALLTTEEKSRYSYPNVRVIPPGGPYFKWPWQRLYKVDMTIQTVDITWDPEIKQDAIEA
eukprot:gene28843-50740_t